MCSAPARDINTVSAQLHLNAQKLAATLPAGKIKVSPIILTAIRLE